MRRVAHCSLLCRLACPHRHAVRTEGNDVPKHRDADGTVLHYYSSIIDARVLWPSGKASWCFGIHLVYQAKCHGCYWLACLLSVRFQISSVREPCPSCPTTVHASAAQAEYASTAAHATMYLHGHCIHSPWRFAPPSRGRRYVP